MLLMLVVYSHTLGVMVLSINPAVRNVESWALLRPTGSLSEFTRWSKWPVVMLKSEKHYSEPMTLIDAHTVDSPGEL